jgi:hypothetical protein
MGIVQQASGFTEPSRLEQLNKRQESREWTIYIVIIVMGR